MEIVLRVLAVVAGAVLVVIAIGLVRVMLLRSRHRRRIADLHPQAVTQAGLFGVASDRATQVRGIGSLVLTDDALVFVTVVGGRDLEVSRESLTSATTPRTFMGRSSDVDLLVVTWERDGLGDAAAFRISDPGTWAEHLR